MTFGCGSPVLADTKPMQFSLNSSKSSVSSKSATGWEIASADDAGQCRASKYVGQGAFLSLSAQEGGYALNLSSARDDFDVWKEYQVALRMDKQESRMTLRPAKFDTVVIPVADIAAFKKAKKFDILVGERQYSFTEAKMGKVVGKLDKCVASANAGSAVFAQMAPASGSAAAPQDAAVPAPAPAVSATTTSTTVTGPDGSAVTTTTDLAPSEGLPPEMAVSAPVGDAMTSAPSAASSPVPQPVAPAGDAAAVTTTTTTTVTPAPAADAPAAPVKAETDKAPAKKPAAGKTAKAPKTPASGEEALADSKSSLTYKPQSTQPACPKGQTCPLVPPGDIAAAQKAQMAPVEEQVVADIKPPVLAAAQPAPAPAPVITGEACMATDEYKNLVRKIGLLEAEKEQLRASNSKKTLSPALQKVAECASESYQIKELRTEIDLIRKENADLRRQAEAVKSADNLSEALNELDASVNNGTN